MLPLSRPYIHEIYIFPTKTTSFKIQLFVPRSLPKPPLRSLCPLLAPTCRHLGPNFAVLTPSWRQLGPKVGLQVRSLGALWAKLCLSNPNDFNNSKTPLFFLNLASSSLYLRVFSYIFAASCLLCSMFASPFAIFTSSFQFLSPTCLHLAALYPRNIHSPNEKRQVSKSDFSAQDRFSSLLFALFACSWPQLTAILAPTSLS